jgi:hypothetical protein
MGWEFGNIVCLVFVYIEKEYDNINKQEIWSVLKRADVHNC